MVNKGLGTRILILVVFGLILSGWFGWRLYHKNSSQTPQKKNQPNKINGYQLWIYFATLFLISTSGLTLFKLYETIQRKEIEVTEVQETNKKIAFTKNNLYEHQLGGIFEAIKQKIKLPETFYLPIGFLLDFEPDGTITAFETWIFGINEAEELEEFSISYDVNESDEILVEVKDATEDTINPTKSLSHLLTMMDQINLEEVTETADPDSSYELVYQNLDNRGNVADEVYYLAKNGELVLTDLNEHTEGYLLSLYQVGNQENKPFLSVVYSGGQDSESDKESKWPVGADYPEKEKTFFFDDQLGYKLAVLDGVFGDYSYNLLRTTNGGENWIPLNEDPYLGKTGNVSGITFIDESLGFIALADHSGTSGTLYRTTDGGYSYDEVDLPLTKMYAGKNVYSTPFTFPRMPYQENEDLFLVMDEGIAPDYKEMKRALYRSDDKGETWTFIREVTPDE